MRGVSGVRHCGTRGFWGGGPREGLWGMWGARRGHSLRDPGRLGKGGTWGGSRGNGGCPGRGLREVSEGVWGTRGGLRGVSEGVWGTRGGLSGCAVPAGISGGSLRVCGVPGGGLGVVQPLFCRIGRGRSTRDTKYLPFICPLWARPSGGRRAEAAGFLLWDPRDVPTAQGAVAPRPNPPREGQGLGGSIQPLVGLLGVPGRGAWAGRGPPSTPSPGPWELPFLFALVLETIPSLPPQQPEWG